MPTPDRKTIYIIPLGDYGTPKQQPTLQTLAAFVEAYYCLPVRLGELTERYRGEGLRALADDGNSGAKMTLNSTRVKMALAEAKKELPDAFAVLGVTLHEVAESGFIALGEACQKRHVCHVDVRSACKVGGLRVCLSVVAHELGHLFQCEHCVHFECVMNGSNHCSEIRGAPLHLCPIELRKIGSSVNHAAGGFDAVERYRALAAFYGANRLSAEAEWVTRRAAEVVQLAKRTAKKAAAAGPTPEEEAPAQEVVEEKWQPQPKPKPQPKRRKLSKASRAATAGGQSAEVIELLASDDEMGEAEAEQQPQQAKAARLLGSDGDEPALAARQASEDVPLAERLAMRSRKAAAGAKDARQPLSPLLPRHGAATPGVSGVA